MPVTITSGTQQPVYVKDNTGTSIQVVKIDVGSGTTLADFGGTITAVNNLANGSVRMTVGTLTTGTLQNLVGGTVSTNVLPDNNFATVVSTGTTSFGTIKAAVSGSAIYITDLIVSVGSVTNVEIGDGTTGATNLLGTLQLAQYGGMVSNFRIPLKTSSGGTLVYKQSVGCPLSLTVLGFVK
jgi:hypothetical protein